MIAQQKLHWRKCQLRELAKLARKRNNLRPLSTGTQKTNGLRFMKRLFIFTFSLLLFEIGYALDVHDFMLVPKSTWVAAFPDLNKTNIQTEIDKALQDANLGLGLISLQKSNQARCRDY